MIPVHLLFELDDIINKFNIPYAYFGDIERFVSDGVLRDIDIYVHRENLKVFSKKLLMTLSFNNYETINIIDNDYSLQLFFYRFSDNRYLHIDLMPVLSYRGIEYLNVDLGSREATYCVGGLPVVRQEYQLVYKILRNILHTGRHLPTNNHYKDIFAQKHEWCLAKLTVVLGDKVSKSIVRDDVFDYVASIRAIRFKFFLSKFTSSFGKSFYGVFSHYSHLVKRFLSPPGVMIAFLGPDGCGKSSVISLLKNTKYFVGSTSFYLLPGFLKRYSHANDGGPAVTDPHAVEPKSFLISILKMIVWWYEYSIGFLIKVVKRLEEGHLVIFDRYFHDILVDQRRYRYGGPRWFVCLISKIIPSPDIFIVLDSPAEIIQARKQEVSYEETERQLHGYKVLAQRLNNVYVIDSDRELNEIAKDINSIILRYLMVRTTSRSMGRSD